ncbi:MAG: hypothetical protein AAFO75_12575, partial [Pseudomonadota bacterium]
MMLATLIVGGPNVTVSVAQHSFQLPKKTSVARFSKAEHVLAFINDYRDDKNPYVVPEAVAAMVRLGILNDPEKSGIYTGFLAGVVQENQVDAERLISNMFPLPPTQQVVLIKAIVYSDLPNWKELLERFVERMPARKALIDRYLFGDG